MLTERIIAAPHLRGPRTQPVRIIILHATRGKSANAATDYAGTKSWFKSRSRGRLHRGTSPRGISSASVK